MKQLTYFDRIIQGNRPDNLRIMYSLKIEYMLPIQRDIERYWRGIITPIGRFLVNTSDDNPTLPLEALSELQQIYSDWVDTQKAYVDG